MRSDFANFIKQNQTKIAALPKAKRNPAQLIASDRFVELCESVIAGTADNKDLNSVSLSIMLLCDLDEDYRACVLDALGQYSADGRSDFCNYDSARRALIKTLIGEGVDCWDLSHGLRCLRNMVANNLELRLKIVEYCYMYSIHTNWPDES